MLHIAVFFNWRRAELKADWRQRTLNLSYLKKCICNNYFAIPTLFLWNTLLPNWTEVWLNPVWVHAARSMANPHPHYPACQYRQILCLPHEERLTTREKREVTIKAKLVGYRKWKVSLLKARISHSHMQILTKFSQYTPHSTYFSVSVPIYRLKGPTTGESERRHCQNNPRRMREDGE